MRIDVESLSRTEKEKIRYSLAKAYEYYFAQSLKNTLWCGLADMRDLGSDDYESPVIEMHCSNNNMVYYTFTYKGVSNPALEDYAHDFDEAHLKVLNELKEEAFKRFSKDSLCRVSQVDWFRHGSDVQVNIALKPATRYSSMHYEKLLRKILGLNAQYPENTFINI